MTRLVLWRPPIVGSNVVFPVHAHDTVRAVCSRVRKRELRERQRDRAQLAPRTVRGPRADEDVELVGHVLPAPDLGPDAGCSVFRPRLRAGHGSSHRPKGADHRDQHHCKSSRHPHAVQAIDLRVAVPSVTALPPEVRTKRESRRGLASYATNVPPSTSEPSASANRAGGAS